MAKNVYIGKTHGPFGIKGEVKLSFESNLKDKVLKNGNDLIIDNIKYKIKQIRSNNKYDLITFEGYEDINLINNLLNKEVYFDKESINIKDEYFIDELLNLKIIDENKKTLGSVEELLYNKNCLYIKTGELIIPMIDKYIDKVVISENVIYVQGVEDLKL